MIARVPKQEPAWIAGQATVLFAIAVLLNYPWERAQAALYIALDGSTIPPWLCFAASLVDGLFLVAIYAVGWTILGRSDWFLHPGVLGYMVMLAAGLTIGVSVEWSTIYLAPQWAYTERMPLMPGLGVGLAPIVQMLVLPPLTFRIATMWHHWASSPPTLRRV
jgi:hypothetical protein